LINKLNGYSSDQLEVMASLYYLRNDVPSLKREELIELFQNYKPHFDRSQIEGGFEIFDIMQPYLQSGAGT
jgi:hypothetical protein